MSVSLVFLGSPSATSRTSTRSGKQKCTTTSAKDAPYRMPTSMASQKHTSTARRCLFTSLVL